MDKSSLLKWELIVCNVETERNVIRYNNNKQKQYFQGGKHNYFKMEKPSG